MRRGRSEHWVSRVRRPRRAWTVRSYERLIRTTIFVCIAGAATACVGPARTFDDYRLKATSTAETTRSAIGTAHLAIDVARRDRAFSPYIAVLVGEAEEDAAGAQ